MEEKTDHEQDQDQEQKKRKVSAAQKRATQKYEQKAYFKALVRFPKAEEEEIRRAAGDSLNGFIVSAVREKIQRERKPPEERKPTDKPKI